MSRLLLNPSTARVFGHGFDKEAVQLIAILAGALGMLLIGLWDDDLNCGPRSNSAASSWWRWWWRPPASRITLFVPSLWFHYAITILWILTVVNAFNFMDNMDGLCAGLGVIGAWCFGVISASQGQFLVAATCFLITGRWPVFSRTISPRPAFSWATREAI